MCKQDVLFFNLLGSINLDVNTERPVYISEKNNIHIEYFLMLIVSFFWAIGHPLWFVCLKRFPASQISIYIYLTPVFAVMLSLIILHERFSWLFWAGSALIPGGIIITNTFSQGRYQAK
ncbi:MAG: DMT family transporter [Actinobacteria bacterium]|nr:DMT family transporter [Actinomycetota bacterium]